MAVLDVITDKRMHHLLRVICRKTSPRAVYLFGSHVNGDADEWSDYDVAVFVQGAETWELHRLIRFCTDVQKEAGDDIELHVFSAAQLEHPEPASFAAYVIKHGVRLPLEYDGV